MVFVSLKTMPFQYLRTSYWHCFCGQPWKKSYCQPAYFWHLQLRYKRMLFWSPTAHTYCKKPLWNFLSLVINYIHIGLNMDWQKNATCKFITPGHYKGMSVQMETSCQASREDPTYEISIWKWMFKPILARSTFWKHLLQQTLPYWGTLKYMKSRLFVVAI